MGGEERSGNNCRSKQKLRLYDGDCKCGEIESDATFLKPMIK